MIEVFKILKGFEDCTWEGMFEVYNRNPRGSTMKLYKKRFSSVLGENVFSNRIVKNWNSLPEIVVQASSILEFKIGYEKFIRINRGQQ